MNLKNQLKLYMQQNDLTASKLASRSGVSKQVLSLWLSGGSPRKIEQVKKVADYFATSVDHLCFGVGMEKAQTINQTIPDDEWLSGVFEIKVRRVSTRSSR